MKLNTIAVAATGLLATGALAHPKALPRSEVARRGTMSKRCEANAANFNKKRYDQRISKRRAEAKRAENATYTITTEAPYYDVIQNDTCVLEPEVTWGPYVYPNSQTLRQDMSEGQPGVPLTLDVGVLDMATCEPLENVMVVSSFQIQFKPSSEQQSPNRGLRLRGLTASQVLRQAMLGILWPITPHICTKLFL